MSIINRKRDTKESRTVFRHSSSAKILCRLDATLAREDREQLQALLSFVFNAGERTGSEKRAAEIREALGLTEKK